MVIDVLGTTIAIDAPGPTLEELGHLLTDLRVESAPARRLRLETDGDDMLRLLEDDVVVRAEIAPVVGAATVVWWLNTVAVSIAPHLLVHAACVGARGAVLLPGSSGAGKSTLAAACIGEGIVYLSDEYAALDRTTGRIDPYARPIELARGLVAASSLGATVATGSMGPAGIVFPRYAPDAPPSSDALAPPAAFLTLLEHAANLGQRRGDAVPWLAALALGCPAWQVTYGDDADAVGLVRDLARRPADALAPAPVIGPVTGTTTTVALGDDTAVFDATTGRVHLLNAGAGLVWLSLAGASLDDPGLDELVQQRARGPLDRATIAATLERLVAEGLVPGRRV